MHARGCARVHALTHLARRSWGSPKPLPPGARLLRLPAAGGVAAFKPPPAPGLRPGSKSPTADTCRIDAEATALDSAPFRWVGTLPSYCAKIELRSLTRKA